MGQQIRIMTNQELMCDTRSSGGDGGFVARFMNWLTGQKPDHQKPQATEPSVKQE